MVWKGRVEVVFGSAARSKKNIYSPVGLTSDDVAQVLYKSEIWEGGASPPYFQRVRDLEAKRSPLITTYLDQWITSDLPILTNKIKRLI
jgi:hypothetical protein